MGDDYWLGPVAQDPWWALRTAQGPRACRPHADSGDQSFRGKGRVPGFPIAGEMGLGTAPESPASRWVTGLPFCSSDTGDSP